MVLAIVEFSATVVITSYLLEYQVSVGVLSVCLFMFWSMSGPIAVHVVLLSHNLVLSLVAFSREIY